LGELAIKQDDGQRALRLLEESLALARQMGHRSGAASALQQLGLVAARLGDLRRAITAWQASLVLHRELGMGAGMAGCYEQLAAVANAQEMFPAALRLWLAAKELRERAGVTLPDPAHAQIEQQLAALHTRLGEQMFAAAWDTAARLTAEQVIAQLEEQIAQPVSASLTPASVAVASAQVGLTARELEILRLITRGLTYGQIAEQLVISPRTVDAHLRSVYDKLGVRSRHEATRYALEHHL
jgi:DNA-binding NarL/FixJ family response regulator